MTTNWHDDVFFGIHYDLHANASDTELGCELTPEHLRERLLAFVPTGSRPTAKAIRATRAGRPRLARLRRSGEGHAAHSSRT